MTYPPADKRTQWYDGVVASSRFPGGRVEKVVWHMTETPGWPGYRDGQIAPHYTAKANFTLRRMEWRAHFPDDHHSRALRNEPGGAQTNLDGALQVEVVGTCDETPGAPAWAGRVDVLRSWELPEWAVEGLAHFAAWVHTEHGVPLRGAGLWLAYGKDDRAPGRVPASYGRSPARLTASQWDSFRGHCGHMHVVENAHGDPGRLPMDRILARAQQLLAPVPTSLVEELMADPAERAKFIADLSAATAAAVLDGRRPVAGWVAQRLGVKDGEKMTASLHELGQRAAVGAALVAEVIGALAAVRADVTRIAEDDGLTAAGRIALARDIAARVERVQVTVQAPQAPQAPQAGA